MKMSESITRMILSHSARPWRPAARRSGQPRPGQARRAWLLITHSANSRGAAISVVYQAARIGRNRPAPPHTRRARTRAHGHAATSTRPAMSCHGCGSGPYARSTRPASVAATACIVRSRKRTVRSSAVVHIMRTAVPRKDARSIAVLGRTLLDSGTSFCIHLLLVRAAATVVKSDRS